ncbi:DUF305 domain-containing protein [Streptomyces hilarionis]|uniref:DUF305 domain-containing protein n=1 Tax=Streptomyces hilarionis TaxID=2839954 RepID=UPI00211A5BDC|nr:DUF305 domain-containing protein [Streptomyces hilarionis]MCQ9129909.1 DUF305 domain-containing protein [Streptomyces hilarionis]
MRTTRSLTRRSVLAAVSVTAALTLAACGADSDGGDAAASSSSTAASSASAGAVGAHNPQDVSFAQGMIPHHRQALEMAELAAGRASSAQVKDLASRIEKAQDPEIQTMSGWLTSWGEKVPSTSDATAGSMPGMDHSGGGTMPGMDHSGGGAMPGMMGASDMDELAKTSGKEFDAQFLAMMVRHHQGAVDMAAVEKSKGAYGPAKTMAGSVVTAQTAEIAEMNRLLGKS